MTFKNLTRIKKIGFTTLILIVSYMLISCLFLGTFIYDKEIRVFTKEESVAQEYIITKPFKLTFSGDSLISHKDDFEIWFNKCRIATIFGIAPLYYTTTDSAFLLFNINHEKTLDNWVLKFNNEQDYLSIDVHGQDYKVKSTDDSLIVNFYHFTATSTKHLGTLKVTWD